MRPKVYVTRRLPREGLDRLAASCDVTVNPRDRAPSKEELLAAAAAADGVVGLLSDPIDADFFKAAGNLKGYANYAVGFDNVDLAEATRRGIPVSNTPGVLTDATAELAWALLFAASRHVAASDREMRAGKWPGWGPLQYLGHGVSGRTLGIVGAGRIGTAMALMSRGFSMKVLYASPRRNEVLERKLSARKTDLDELLAQSDFVSIHTPLDDSTRHLIGPDAFARMKETAVLVNTARGPVVDEAALVTALKTGRIAAAGLDVYENEPQTAPGLAELENAVLTTHIGSATFTARTDMSLMVANDLLDMLQGKKPEHCLNPEVFG
ncbi:MAG: D-glycerate dehydrogenase [Deltaproteobacteria bacterium]|nr:D-glycerate dehydrogenase [Deltaproteobacteria bacterium]